VQRYVTGPYAFIAYVSVSKTLGSVNWILMYADDFNLLIPENCDVSAEDEMKHIVSWRESNKLYINFTKCR